MEIEEKLKLLESRFRTVQQIVSLGCWEWDIEHDTLYWSDEIYRIFGLVPNEFEATYEAFLSFVHRDDREKVSTAVQAALKNEGEYNIHHRIVLENGVEKIVNERGEVTFSKSGEPLRMLGTVQDVTDIKEKERELKKLSSAIDHSVNMILMTDRSGNIEYVNRAFEESTGYKKEDIIGETPRLLASGDTDDETYKELYETIWSGKLWKGVFKNINSTGNPYWVNASISPITDDNGSIVNFISVQENITEKMKSEERIEYLANYDDVTGSYNRNKFINLLDDWVDEATESLGRGVLLILNLDDFKSINDTFGHLSGDNILRHTAETLKKVAKEMDLECADLNCGESFVARFSSDEFGMFLPQRKVDEALQTAETVKRKFEEGNFGDLPLRLSISVGVSVYPKHGVSSSELLSKADIACFKAKSDGGNAVHIFRPEDKDYEKLNRRINWREKIQVGLENKDFLAHFQPIKNFTTNRCDHFEALARLKGPNGKVFAPGNFIDIAESFGLVGQIDRQIMEKAIEFISLNNNEIKVSVNLSGKDLVDESLLEYISKVIEKYKVDPACVIFEITETAAVGDIGLAKKFINELKAMGSSFALDDFGVGFTSFKYLQEMDIDYIKIDGSFVRRLDEDKADQLFVKAIVDVAKGMGIKTIAEYVENETTYNLLRGYGVDYGQGYFIGKPVPKEELKVMVK